ncbi:MAG: ABC transporter ATP-binding protein [Nevskiales bacterium]|nr:ABC transporter ATP-binding protein [Nevskiales bacterium]
MLRVRGLRFSRRTQRVLDGVDLDIPRGKTTAILGPSGCGKTTLLRVIGGEWRPAAGTVEFDGTDVHALNRRELFQLRQRMGMMFQSASGALLTDLTTFDNIAFPLREHTDLSESMIGDVVQMKLQAVGLLGAEDLQPGQLSGGMARRVALARAIALDPELVMYDEPFAGQDPITLGVLVRLIRTIAQGLGITGIVVSHSVEEALSVSDYAYVMVAGRMLAHGTPDEITASPSEEVQQFLKGEMDGPVPFHYNATAVPS